MAQNEGQKKQDVLLKYMSNIRFMWTLKVKHVKMIVTDEQG